MQRALQRGDVLQTATAAATSLPRPTPAWWFAFDPLPQHRLALRFVPCRGDRAPVEAFADRAWQVDPRSNRQGVRLAGEPLSAPTGDIVSLPVAPGTIQLPPDGRPIVLLAATLVANTVPGSRRRALLYGLLTVGGLFPCGYLVYALAVLEAGRDAGVELAEAWVLTPLGSVMIVGLVALAAVLAGRSRPSSSS